MFLYTLHRTLIIDLFLVTNTSYDIFPWQGPVYMSFNFMYATFPMALKYFNHSATQMEWATLCGNELPTNRSIQSRDLS